MASKCRTIDPELFQKADFLRASYVAREVWLGIICCCADDEGRFEADAWGLAEKLFSSVHDANEQAVSAALTYWQERGWVLLYEEGRYGFLTGWYEHQYIRSPEPSSYPAPPLAVNSWHSVQAIKRWYMEHHGGKDNTHFRTVLREYEQSLSTGSEQGEEQVRTECALSANQVRVEGKGREEKGTEENDPLDAGAHEAGGSTGDAGSPAGSDADFDHMADGNYPELAAAVAKAQPTWSRDQQRRFRLGCIHAIEDAATDVDEARVLQWLGTEGMVPSNADTYETWMRRMLAKQAALQRGARASPGKRQGPTDHSKFGAGKVSL